MSSRPHHPIQLAAPGGEISRKDLNTLIRRFLYLHRQRLQNLYAWLPPRQRDCLEILPLLFHCNHPALPGYGNGQAPAGISAYFLNSATRKAAQRLIPGFNYRRLSGVTPPIHGLFLMDSGSIAHSKRSDLEVWICHRSDLGEEEIAALRVKCKEVETWAGVQGLKVHFFLIDPEGFRQGQLEPLFRESSGTAQCGLLLEEFYRTAVHLAGCKLLWWLVPPEQEDRYREYADYLLTKRFVDPNSVIDLGGLDNVSAEEFVSAGLWQLSKALDSPYQALLKLQLVLDYAAAYPRPKWLATWIKAAVYGGRLEAEALDPYLCLYQRVEQYASAQEQTELLPLIRRCFVINTYPALNHPAYRHQLTALLQAFGLDPSSFGLGKIGPKRIEQAEQEWQILIQTLKQNYYHIRQFTSRYGSDQILEKEVLRLLGRKLQAALERRPDKVDIVRLVPEAGLPETTLSLSLEQAQDSGWYWRLDRGRDHPLPNRPLYQARHLIQVIAWSQVNGVSQTDSQWTLHPRQLPLTAAELKFLNQGVRRLLHLRAESPLQAYSQPARIQAAALFLNIAAPTHPQRSGFEVTSERFDPLSYGAERCALVHHLEVLSYDSWGEIQVNRYEGLEGLLDCLCRLYEQGGANAAIQAYCFSSRTLALRVLSLYRELAQTLGRNPASWFVLRGGAHLYLFRYRDGRLDWWQCEDELALTEALGQARTEFTPVAFDSQALKNSPLPFLYRHNQPGKVQLFLLSYQGGVEVFVLDERGALYRQDYPGAPPQTVLQRYTVLLEALAQRHPGSGEAEYTWIDAAAGSWRLKAAQAHQPLQPAIQVRVYAEEVPGSPPRFTLVCNDREFSSLELGDKVFAEAAHYIRRLRHGGEGYPCYVSDLKVPARVLGLTSPALFHTACLLAYKRKVEQRLNQ